MATLYNLPNLAGVNVNNLTNEATVYQTLYNKVDRTTSGEYSFTSISSGITYNTQNALYIGDNTIYSKGEDGMINLLAKHILANFLPNAEILNNKVEQEELDEIEDNLNAHKAENATDAHNAGNIGFSPPTGMTATDLQEAVEEVFQSGNSVKMDMVDALLLVDPSLPISYESTWAEIESAAGQISTGKKTASGTANLVTEHNQTSAFLDISTNIDFTPTKVYVDIPQIVDSYDQYKIKGVVSLTSNLRGYFTTNSTPCIVASWNNTTKKITITVYKGIYSLGANNVTVSWFVSE